MTNTKKYLENILFNKMLFLMVLITYDLVTLYPFSSSIVGIIGKLIMLWGALIAVDNVFFSRIALRSRASIFILVFLFFNGITILVNIKHGLFSNISNFLANIVLLLAIYPCGQEFKDNIEKKFRKINFVISSISFIISAVSLLVGFILVSIYLGDNIFGFELHSGRFWGITRNTNLFAYMTMISVSASTINILLGTKYRKFYLVNIGIQIFTMILTDSRTVKIGMLFAAATMFVIWFLETDKIDKLLAYKKVVRKRLTKVGIIFAVFFVSWSTTNSVYSTVQLASQKAIKFTHLSFSRRNSIDGKDDGLDGFFIGRNHDEEQIERMENDVSTGRIGIWKRGLEKYRSNLLFGVGQANIQIDHKVRGKYFTSNLHNGFIQILISNGILSLIPFLAMTIYCFYKMTKYIRDSFLKGKQILFYKVLFSILMGLIMINMVSSDILNSLSTLPFYIWFSLGILMSYTEEDKFMVDSLLERVKK